MEYENRMEQHYAVSKSGVLLHINDAHRIGDECFCPYCGCRMLKKCGSVRAWHFAHDYRFENEIDKHCSYESYLHEFAKMRLKKWFEESKSIHLYYKQQVGCLWANKCKWKEAQDVCSKAEEKVINLKKYLTGCKVEETVHIGNELFRADLYWFNTKNPKNNIMIEVKVTHECTSKKKASNARIIEFEIHSEEDVEKIVSNDIREGENVRFYGFTPVEKEDKDVSAKYSLNKFVYYSSGKAFPRSGCDCKTYSSRRKGALLEITVKECYNDIFPLHHMMANDSGFQLSIGRFYNWGLSLAKTKGYDVRNCYLCKLHKYNYDKNELSCEITKCLIRESTDALNCLDYCFDQNMCNKNIAELQQYSQHHVIDVWSPTT